ncbi:Hypothetical predicted protein [Olea europaea subsp. europaea]|uniref:Leucine-rich repeat-containing N-terminal plant-type domain-containing protein n=1 Tax=Olea europaea subsp. europaea TaxID=158383 RepID=A0A8S0SMX5_OLEEU|nr:Hypothetical predicted protein [Olea europaea subsp. europaea]
MAKLCKIACLITIVFSAILAFRASAFTDNSYFQTLRDLFRSLNSPPQLKEWKLEGGDPCEESLTGVSCFGSSVIHLNLSRNNFSQSILLSLQETSPASESEPQHFIWTLRGCVQWPGESNRNGFIVQ